MAKQKLGMSSFDINKKFASEEEAYRHARNLKQFIRQTCENNKDNGYIAQAIIGVSNTNGKLVSGVYNEQIGKKGRPKKVKDICTNEKVTELLGNLHTDWHIHILLVSKPSYTFRNKIKNYVDKNWFKMEQLYEEKEFDFTKLDTIEKLGGKAYKKNTNISMAQYIILQSSKVLFCDFNYTNDKGFKYTLKKLYNESIKVATALRFDKDYRYDVNNTREKIEKNYKDILDYYYSITKEQDTKRATEYMERVQRNRITYNYNKVQINNYRRTYDTLLF